MDGGRRRDRCAATPLSVHCAGDGTPVLSPALTDPEKGTTMPRPYPEVTVKPNGELRMSLEVFRKLNKYDVCEHLERRVVHTLPQPALISVTHTMRGKQQ